MGIQDRYKSRKLDQLISFSFFAHPNVLFYHIPVFVIDIFFSLLILAAGSLVVLAKVCGQNVLHILTDLFMLRFFDKTCVLNLFPKQLALPETEPSAWQVKKARRLCTVLVLIVLILIRFDREDWQCGRRNSFVINETYFVPLFQFYTGYSF